MESLGIGFSNLVNSNRIIAIVSPETNPIKRIVQKAKEDNSLIDVTFGRKTRSVIILYILYPLQQGRRGLMK